MLRAMDSAVAGLRAHQNKLDVIGHNIANVNTFGFKSQSYSFQEAMYQTTSSSTGGTSTAGGTNAAQFGYGSLMGSISMDMTASTPTYVGGLNASINGDGFFITYTSIKDGVSPEALLDNEFAYTRVGQFKIDSNGYLVDAQGNFVYGFRSSGTPTEIMRKEQDKNANGDLAWAEIGADGNETGNVVYAATKPAGNYKAKMIEKGTGEYSVDYTPEEDLNALRAPIGMSSQGVPEFGESDTDALELSSISIDKLGRLTATIKSDDKTIDGKVVTLGWVAIATFQNPEGLTKSGGVYYEAKKGDNTGAFSATVPGGSTSTLMSGYLEASNVDLATQFSDMITTQRGFQANTKMITVSDEILNELVNMKR